MIDSSIIYQSIYMLGVTPSWAEKSMKWRAWSLATLSPSRWLHGWIKIEAILFLKFSRSTTTGAAISELLMLV